MQEQLSQSYIMSRNAEPKHVLITGCSSGFGILMVQQFLADGWHVTGTTRSPGNIGIENERLHVMPCDIASAEGRALVLNRFSAGSRLDCLINNAGYGQVGPLEALSEAQIRQQMEVNFFAPVLLIRDLLPVLRENNGRIINISSVLGIVGMPMQSLYCASKFAIEGLTESLYYELSVHGVQVCLVEPGGFRTKFGDNMKWPAETTMGNQKYQKQMEGYRARLKQRGAKPGNDPLRVAKVVAGLARSPSMPLRVRVGDDTRAIYYLRRALPQRVADRVLRGISRKFLEPESENH